MWNYCGKNTFLFLKEALKVIVAKLREETSSFWSAYQSKFGSVCDVCNKVYIKELGLFLIVITLIILL